MDSRFNFFLFFCHHLRVGDRALLHPIFSHPHTRCLIILLGALIGLWRIICSIRNAVWDLCRLVKLVWLSHYNVRLQSCLIDMAACWVTKDCCRCALACLDLKVSTVRFAGVGWEVIPWLCGFGSVTLSGFGSGSDWASDRFDARWHWLAFVWLFFLYGFQLLSSFLRCGAATFT